MLKHSIDSFWENMYNSYWNDTSNFEHTIAEVNIDTYNNIDLISSLFSVKYCPPFILSVLLYKPNLWSAFSKKEWTEIIEGIKRPIETKFLFEDYGMYCDIVFLHRYLKIDALKLLMHNQNIPNEKKKEIFIDIDKISSELIYTSFDDENFDDKTYPNKELYILTSEKLYKQGCGKSDDNDENVKVIINKYIQYLDINTKPK